MGFFYAPLIKNNNTVFNLSIGVYIQATKQTKSCICALTWLTWQHGEMLNSIMAQDRAV